MDIKKTSRQGTMISGALTFAALFVLIYPDQHFDITFTLDTLPRWMKQMIEQSSDGILITATKISKDENVFRPLSDEDAAAIMLNKIRRSFGKNDTDELKERVNE